MKMKYADAMQLLKKYDDNDEPLRVLYASKSDDVQVGLIGSVSIVQGKNIHRDTGEKDETWLHIWGGDHPGEVGWVYDLWSIPCFGFKLHSKIKFHYGGDYDKPWGRVGSGDSCLHISNEEGDEVTLMELPDEEEEPKKPVKAKESSPKARKKAKTR